MAIFEGSFTTASNLKVGIVVARFNDLITNKILSGCLDCLKRHGLDTSETSETLDIVWVPGSFELPIAAKTLLKKSNYDVLISLGAVIRGETSHYDVVISEASKGIAQVSYDYDVPIIFGVLTTDSMQQALERAGIKNNLGWNYALQAIEMGSLIKNLN
ncbi:Putative 6,7-dimethyl-8-ribityllumazine synthase or riboflavin synthase beta chain [Prochlorococcus marinus str. MIT 9515]|uniref:6,7-dimethyl-8-ribityllumazine synthase n=1 Tax=Prochlorococcus marinus (strain MIT 9515) TaxID=167542 RepID=RISB_PROM5|nr:6,7-dimethyl-8-ribityllumazine synthase [Prochlorococcus marinus]A2BZ29.1 RecName: Full=6,7-dimethyl-8-ribityllumazine synthase; Short=DMRL synthase; Short=LS; Short=Lumazine synthase [Prochlorococcus marinus str. MIT 9515]ABM73040.1 Putative 6,7-dimethyl-8-ribityllumazine synthase or riboflavin synthase beta chain [Prochlorococcus marinus str. MIT 9515]